jgi:hypothetical protein
MLGRRGVGLAVSTSGRCNRPLQGGRGRGNEDEIREACSHSRPAGPGVALTRAELTSSAELQATLGPAGRELPSRRASTRLWMGSRRGIIGQRGPDRDHSLLPPAPWFGGIVGDPSAGRSGRIGQVGLTAWRRYSPRMHLCVSGTGSVVSRHESRSMHPLLDLHPFISLDNWMFTMR